MRKAPVNVEAPVPSRGGPNQPRPQPHRAQPRVNPGGRRPFSQDTPLGKLLAYRRLTATQLSARADIHPRILSDYLAGRKKPTAVHALRLAKVLDVRPILILNPEALVAKAAAKAKPKRA